MFSPPNSLLAVKNDCLHSLGTVWIPFLIQMSQFCFNSKNNGVAFVHKTPPSEKPLPQFDRTTCLEMLLKASPNYEVKPNWQKYFANRSSLNKSATSQNKGKNPTRKGSDVFWGTRTF